LFTLGEAWVDRLCHTTSLVPSQHYLKSVSVIGSVTTNPFTDITFQS